MYRNAPGHSHGHFMFESFYTFQKPTALASITDPSNLFTISSSQRQTATSKELFYYKILLFGWSRCISYHLFQKWSLCMTFVVVRYHIHRNHLRIIVLENSVVVEAATVDSVFQCLVERHHQGYPDYFPPVSFVLPSIEAVCSKRATSLSFKLLIFVYMPLLYLKGFNIN
jgi:hypothetical protein